MVYFLLRMEWDGERRPGSTIRASPPCANPERAQAWSDSGPLRPRKNAQRWIVGITNEKLIAALGPGRDETRERVKKVRRVISQMESPLRVDMGKAALVACNEETEILIEALDDLTTRRERHHHSRGLRAQWAAQLLLRTSHLAGEALNRGARWPCTWTNPNSTKPGRGVCRGRREEQVAVLTWRIVKQKWPLGEQRVAFWWSQRRRAEKSVG